jgi:hypothetical protein
MIDLVRDANIVFGVRASCLSSLLPTPWCIP